MNRLIPLIILFGFFLGCDSNTATGEDGQVADLSSQISDKDEAEVLSRDPWRAAIQIQEEEIPFDLVFERGDNDAIQRAYIENGEERVKLPGLKVTEDTVYLPFPVFASEIRLSIEGENLQGTWYNDARTNHNRLEVRGQKFEPGIKRITETSPNGPANFSGSWEVEFVYQEKEKTKAIGIFEQSGRDLKGTFRTETGDYRYLVGAVYGKEMKLSTFDGAHAFLFHAEKLEDGSLKGEFYSGAHWFETWTATLNPDYQLSNPDSLTFMKRGESKLDFAFINSKDIVVSTSDIQYRDKAIVVQIMGTWCPNCKDETSWLNEVYATYHDQGLEVISLAFELSTDTTAAFENINKVKEYFEVPYQILFAGRAGRKTAGAALPQLNHVMSYPTTIFMDRNHEVKRIYTGFNGPATGVVYEKLIESFEATIRQLLQSA